MNNFSKKLRIWYKNNKRDLPWRNTSNPFKIWLSEIMLQQTRVEQGMSYYLKFTQRFSNVSELAKASEDEVLSMWQGLGYYSRGRNLRKAAIQVVEEFDGEFPTNSKELKKLKGVGDYSAAAIASFSSNEKIAVVDGNVYRVLSRIYGIDTPIDTTLGKKEFNELANELISSSHPAEHNQAIMEFGALHCTPKKPNCETCVFQDNCEAFNQQKVFDLPVKSKKIKRKSRYFNFYLSLKKDKILLEKRDDKGIWANMYQLPLVECKAPQKKPDLLFETKHVLTHQDLFCCFYLENNPDDAGKTWVPLSEINNYALPIVIDKFLRQYFN